MFHTNYARITTADVNQVKLVAKYFQFYYRCLKAEVQIGNNRVRSLLNSSSELNLIRGCTAQQLDLLISSLPPQMANTVLKATNST